MKILYIILVISLFLTGCSFLPENSYSETQFLLDTVCTIEAGGENAETAVKAAFEKIGEIQKYTDFYDENSTVSRFNNAKTDAEIPLDEHTAEILKTCLEVSEASEGAFDITIASVTQLWDFKEEKIPDAEEIKNQLDFVGYNKLIYNEDKKTLAKVADGVKIDLGGAAKGYCADMAAKVLKDNGAAYALINLGGNIVAFGENPHRQDNSWQIGIKKPFGKADEYEKTVTVDGRGAVVTSGTYERCFERDGKIYHHILDPETGYPADTGVSSVTITADSALLADCLSTACLVLGGGKDEKLAEKFNADIYIQ